VLEPVAFASSTNGVPGFFDAPRTFVFQPGETTINPALDRAIAEMRPGERRTIVVPAEHGYGRNGLYTAEIPGQPRFVISPNTLLVYDVEVLP
jgi:FKBP-type peptidyl-prolyl cis-trans isomerase